MEAPMNNLYIGLLRLENRAAFFVQAKASQVTPRETAEERFHTLARGWLAYPVTPMHAHLPPKSGCISYLQGDCVCVGVIGFANRWDDVSTTALRRFPSVDVPRSGGWHVYASCAICSSKRLRTSLVIFVFVLMIRKTLRYCLP